MAGYLPFVAAARVMDAARRHHLTAVGSHVQTGAEADTTLTIPDRCSVKREVDVLSLAARLGPHSGR